MGDRLQQIKDGLAARQARWGALPTALTDENVVATAMRFVGKANDDDLAWLVEEIERLHAEDDAVGDLTRAELMTALVDELMGREVEYKRGYQDAEDAFKAERERRLDDAVELGEAAESMVSEARKQADLYRRSLEMLAADVERLENESAGHTSEECEADAIQAEYEALATEVRPWIKRSGTLIYLNSPLLRDEESKALRECEQAQPQEARP